MNRVSKSLKFLISLFLVLAVWELAATRITNLPLFISSPSSLIAYITNEHQYLITSLLYTTLEALLGLFIASIVGILFWLISFTFPRWGGRIYPILAASQVIPFVCLAPLIVLIFGFGLSGKVVLSAIMAFFPLVTNLLVALRTINNNALDQMKLLNASNFQILQHVVWPHSVQFFFAAQRTAVPFAVIGAIVAEFSGAEHGIGKNIYIASRRLEPELLMSNILASFLLAGFIYSLVMALESLIGRWYRRKHYG